MLNHASKVLVRNPKYLNQFEGKRRKLDYVCRDYATCSEISGIIEVVVSPNLSIGDTGSKKSSEGCIS
jgi:hypothetical protein